MKAATIEHWYEKGFAPIFIIIGVALLAGAGFLVSSKQLLNKDFAGLKNGLFPNILNSPSPCANGWQDYTNKDFSYEFKIPTGWTDDSIDERQSQSISYRHLVSTTRPEEQVDPKFKLSLFEIIASKNDLKTDPDYGRWFDDNTGNRTESQVTFKGVTAIKYVNDTPMPAGSHHFEMYYFKKGDFYYWLNLGIYTTPDVKVQNEAILKCFLDNFKLLTQEEPQEDVVNGMKLFTSQKLQFKIRYPAELFVHEWQSDYQVDYNREKPDYDRNIVQFFRNEDLKGDKITVTRYANTQRKTAKDYAKAYLSASEQSLGHWKPGSVDFVVHTYKIQGSNVEEKEYLTPLGDWMYVFTSDVGLQQALEKMLPTLEFTGTGEAFSKNLIPCLDNLLSTEAEIIEQANWQGKPDLCESKPEQKICGYIRSIFDNGRIAFSNSDYRNPYCYCSFFDKSGRRTFRGTEMFVLGYEERVCKEKIK